jgi:hypothetical protein
VSREAGELSIYSLPPPVARYIKHALLTEKRRIVIAHYRQVGTLRTDTRSERWMNFTASQVTSPSLSEYVWDARFSLMPLLYLRVIDSFVGGRGAGQVALLSAVPIGSAGGTTEMNSSSLHRFLAEAVWYPTALLPIPALSWTLIDDASALVTLTQGAISVSLEFRFNQCDEVESVGGDHLMVGSNRLPEKACFETMLGAMAYSFRIRVRWAGTPTVNGVLCGPA